MVVTLEVGYHCFLPTLPQLSIVFVSKAAEREPLSKAGFHDLVHLYKNSMTCRPILNAVCTCSYSLLVLIFSWDLQVFSTVACPSLDSLKSFSNEASEWQHSDPLPFILLKVMVVV